jgi:hypothetical protein
VAIPKTTEVIVIQTPKQGVTPQQIMAVIPSEIRATVKLYLDGKIRQWYSRGDGKGVIFLVDAKTEDEARAVMEVRWLRGVPDVAIAPYRGRTHATASPTSKRVSLLMIVGGLVTALSQSKCPNATT